MNAFLNISLPCEVRALTCARSLHHSLTRSITHPLAQPLTAGRKGPLVENDERVLEYLFALRGKGAHLRSLAPSLTHTLHHSPARSTTHSGPKRTPGRKR